MVIKGPSKNLQHGAVRTRNATIGAGGVSGGFMRGFSADGDHVRFWLHLGDETALIVEMPAAEADMFGEALVLAAGEARRAVERVAVNEGRLPQCDSIEHSFRKRRCTQALGHTGEHSTI